MNKSLQSINSGISLAKNAFVGFAAGFGVDFTLGAARSILSYADDLDAAAQQANVSVERFQTLKESFRALELDGDKFDNVLRRLSSTLGDVQNGAEDGATKALDRMGISTKILSGEIDTTDELLDAIVGSAKRFGSEAQYTAASVDILGKKLGVDFAAATRDGGAGLRDLESGLRSTGTVISADMVTRLADANESIDRFTSATKRTLAIWAGDLLSLFDRVGQGFSSVSKLEGSGGNPAEQASSLRKQVADAKASLADLEDGTRRNSTRRSGGEDRLANRELLNERARLRSIIAQGEKDAARLEGNARAAAAVKGSVPKIEAPSAGSSSPKSSTGRSGSSLADAAAEDAKRLSANMAGYILEQQRSLELEGLRGRGMELAADLLDSQYEIESRFPKLAKETTDQYQARLKPLLDANAALITQKDSTERIKDILSNIDYKSMGIDIVHPGIVKVGEDAKKLSSDIKKSWSDTADGVLDSLDRIESGIRGGGILQTLSGVIGLLEQLGSVGLFGKSIAANINSSRARAAGGPVTGGSTYLVGEKGPELFTPGTSGAIIPNHRLQGAQAAGARMQRVLGANNDNARAIVVKVEANDYFDAKVSQISTGVAAPLAVRSGVAASADAQQSIAKRGRRRIP
ncbi:hypothetical protein BH10PSE12_BH10PSE12_02660 [soil metagenome]